MPMAVAGAIMAGLSSSWVAGGMLIFNWSWTSFMGSLVMSGLSMLMAPKAPKPKGVGSAIQNTGITQQIRQPIIVRKPVYGEIRRSGGLLFACTSSTNKYIHMIIEVAPHEVSAINEVWLHDYCIPDDWLDADGVVTTGKYANKVRIRKYLGTSTQTADSLLVSESDGKWTTNHRLRGIAYLYVRMEWDSDLFPSGIPNISAWVKGKKLYDPRTSLTEYSENPALILYDYLTDATFGLSAQSFEIDSAYMLAAANVCDEFVTVQDYATSTISASGTSDIITMSGDKLYFQRGDRVRLTTAGTLPTGLAINTDYYVIPYQRQTTPRIRLATSYANAMSGTYIDLTSDGVGTFTVTKKAEPRYTGSFYLDTEQSVDENIKEILAGMIGDLIYTGGTFRVQAGAYQTPEFYFDENNIVSNVSVNTKISARERFNTIRGVYVSGINDGQPTDYPQVKNDTYIATDGEAIVKQSDMPMANRPTMCQRIAKIALELSRQEISWSADFDLSALRVAAGANAYFTFEKFGWTDKVFAIKEWKIDFKGEGDGMRPVVSMMMREIASGCYDWNSGEETSVDLAPNSTLPDPFTVDPVTGLAISSELVQTQAGDNLYKILLQWNLSDDQFVLNGGHYELEYKESASSTWRPTYVIDGAYNFAEVSTAASINTQYDVRMRAVNSIGVRSAYTTISNYVVGSSGGVGTTQDWGNFVDSPSSHLNWGDYNSPPDTTEDWGYFT